MQGILYLVSLIIFLGLFACYILHKKGKIKLNLDKYLKIISLVLAAAFTFRYMWAGEAIQDTFELTNILFDSKVLNAYILILHWSVYAAVTFMCLYPFFKKIRGLEVVIKYFVLPVSILAYGSYFLLGKAVVGNEAFMTFDAQLLFMAIEFGLLIAASLIVFLEKGKFKSTKQRLKFLWLIPVAFLFTLPPYMLQALFGHLDTTMEVMDLSILHRIMIYGSIIMPVVIYFLLKKRDKAIIKFVLLYISIGTLISFVQQYSFKSFLTVTNWPLHLCNTAMFIIPLCLIFKWDKLFYFTYFINVLGAFLAMIMPNFAADSNILGYRCVSFFINHYMAFFMPLLIVALRVYKRPRLKEFKYSMIGFGIYFAIVLVCNAWFSNYGEVDYFFINSDFIADKLGLWAENLRLITWNFNINNLSITLYPVYQALFFLVYVALGAGMWFIYELAYVFADTMTDMAEKKEKIRLDQLALEIALGGREKTEPMSLENQNKIVLKNFSKRYGKSSVYAVKDANLEIEGGNVFGFLGHNGAGKSTIIKSIVGIQPITSGSIEVCGYDVDKQPVMAKKQIGFVPDHYALYEKLTGREYINYIADLYNVTIEDRNERINRYLKLFELESSFDNQIKTYSHGMKQKIAIMSALVHNPRVWILDEPLTGLDPNSIYQVKQCMKQHAQEGNIVFFSSHLIDIVEQLCDKIAIIKKGQILCVKSLDEIDTTKMSLEKFYMETTENAAVDSVVVKEEKTEEVVTKKHKKGVKNV